MIQRMLCALALAATLALAGCFGAATPQEMLTSIEELQSKNYPLNEQQKTDVSESVAKGKAAMAAGQDEAAKAAFEKAIEVLKFAESAAVYNKAD